MSPSCRSTSSSLRTKKLSLQVILVFDQIRFLLLFRVLSFAYLSTLVSSNAPKARSEAFCASVRPRMPVIVSRS